MPIKTSKDIIGVLTISRKTEGTPYSQENIEAITPLLSNAAFTYENLQLLRKFEKSEYTLSTIDKIYKVLNSDYQRDDLLHAILNEIKTFLSFDIGFVLFADEHNQGHFIVTDWLANAPFNFVKGQSVDCRDTLIENVSKQSVVTFVDDLGSLKHPIEKEMLLRDRIEAWVCLPLRAAQKTIGVLILSVQSYDDYHNHNALLSWIAQALASALDRNSLASAVVKRDLELDTVKQIGNAMASSTFDTSKVLNYTMDMIRLVMNVQAGSLFLIDNDQLEFAAAFNMDLSEVKRVRLSLGQGIAGHVAARGEPLIVHDAEASPHFFPDVDKITGFTTRSILCVPMISQGKVIGVIEVLNKKDSDFNQQDADLLKSIAASVSIGIENARLYKEKVTIADHERGVRRMFQKFVPKPVLDRIITEGAEDRPAIEELKQVTLLNVDIRNFSNLSRALGPQKTVSLLNTFFAAMGGFVFRHQGIVDKYLGDGFLALFGAPASSPKDTDNALCAALAMKAAMDQLNDRLSKELGVALIIGISVHTGEVVVGNIGFEMKMDYTVIGDAVNEVFRLQKLAKELENGVLVSEAVCQAAKSRLQLRSLNLPHQAFSLIRNMRVYELLGIEEADQTVGAA
jgi:class 3 adenylate cyclase/putative methionine-R-sulfoxide reductase with GAF domain